MFLFLKGEKSERRIKREEVIFFCETKKKNLSKNHLSLRSIFVGTIYKQQRVYMSLAFVEKFTHS